MLKASGAPSREVRFLRSVCLFQEARCKTPVVTRVQGRAIYVVLYNKSSIFRCLSPKTEKERAQKILAVHARIFQPLAAGRFAPQPAAWRPAASGLAASGLAASGLAASGLAA